MNNLGVIILVVIVLSCISSSSSLSLFFGSEYYYNRVYNPSFGRGKLSVKEKDLPPRCVFIPNSSKEDGVSLVNAVCDPEHKDQHQTFTYVKDLLLRLDHSDKCLDQDMKQQKCSEKKTGQQWDTVGNTFKNRETKKCMSVLRSGKVEPKKCGSSQYKDTQNIRVDF